MSARKLGRLAGLVFVLVAAFGGVAANAVAAPGAAAQTETMKYATLDSVWL
ncbi:hypothetical protein [Actinoplanes teichomyceticus]|uniref:Uncharacterized protein n=1 Tax=Actinoplanes teichomyceticus TaxID=1867 RepID=A0A561VQQ9_ACTTI|nr:hypothetical protein [Actinoplanes teichomyceticus]TWG13928.1 hypothetical protein FHX34_104220 [Actinoplanes teichomyceticus]GIF12248.1 hypothetical protein Ate01nite_22800 [Actinoplanes teichomyceticus]